MGTTIKHKRKAGAFAGGELAQAEWGFDITNSRWYYSADGTTVTLLPTGTDEAAQDAVGGILADSATIDLTYADATPEITASVKPDSVGASLLHASAADVIFGRSPAGAGAGEEIPCTAAGRALLDDASAAAQRTTLELGTANAPTFAGLTVSKSWGGAASTQLLGVFDSYADQTRVVLRRANGSPGGETQVLLNDNIGGVQFRGWHSGGAFGASSSASIAAQAAENFTSGGVGAKLNFTTTAAGSTTAAVRLTITDAGQVQLTDAAAPSSSPSNLVQLWSESVGGNSELRVRDELGNVTTLSPHAKDAPAWMYDEGDVQPPLVSREANVFAGSVRFVNHTRAARLQQLLFDGKELPKDAQARKVIHEETFDAYNARMGYAAGDPRGLSREEWGENEAKNHEARERERNDWRRRGGEDAEAPQPYVMKPAPTWLGRKKKAE